LRKQAKKYEGNEENRGFQADRRASDGDRFSGASLHVAHHRGHGLAPLFERQETIAPRPTQPVIARILRDSDFAAIQRVFLASKAQSVTVERVMLRGRG
jgi:hypothetical protein